MHKSFVEFELADGSVHTLRIMLADKLAGERTGRARGWKDDQVATWGSFYAWSAAKRNQVIPDDMTYEQWINEQLVDVFLHSDDSIGDPTQAAPQAA